MLHIFFILPLYLLTNSVVQLRLCLGHQGANQQQRKGEKICQERRGNQDFGRIYLTGRDHFIETLTTALCPEFGVCDFEGLTYT